MPGDFLTKAVHAWRYAVSAFRGVDFVRKMTHTGRIKKRLKIKRNDVKGAVSIKTALLLWSKKGVLWVSIAEY